MQEAHSGASPVGESKRSACAKGVEIVLIRHGETTWNKVHRLQGWTDTDLSEKGRAQAAAAAKELASGRWGSFDVLVSSDLKRARCTAEPTAAALGLPIVTDARLREHNLGVFQGMTMADARQRYPEEVRRYFNDASYPIPDGESRVNKHERVSAAIEDIATKYPGQRVLVFTHGGALDCVHMFATRTPVTEVCRGGPRPNCSISLIRHVASDTKAGSGRWEVAVWCDSAHLQGELAPLTRQRAPRRAPRQTRVAGVAPRPSDAPAPTRAAAAAAPAACAAVEAVGGGGTDGGAGGSASGAVTAGPGAASGDCADGSAPRQQDATPASMDTVRA